MIKYSLKCKSCDYIFESWFASSKEYEKLTQNFNLHYTQKVNYPSTAYLAELIAHDYNNDKQQYRMSVALPSYIRRPVD